MERKRQKKKRKIASPQPLSVPIAIGREGTGTGKIFLLLYLNNFFATNNFYDDLTTNPKGKTVLPYISLSNAPTPV